MASKLHQFIMSLIVRKMKLEGYEIIAYDGDYTQIENMDLKIPFRIMRHRPDIIGISYDKSNICIGEAKTSSDLHSERTKEEILDYSSIRVDIDRSVKLIIGIPKSSNLLLLKLIYELKLMNNKNIECLLVPENLFTNA